jgi:Zn-finger nucleic acid-binding protein
VNPGSLCQICNLHGVAAIVKEEGREVDVIACPRCHRVLRRVAEASK